MWSIRDMKERGWAWVRHIYGAAYAACLIVFVMNGLMSERMNPLLPVNLSHPLMEKLHGAGVFWQIFLLLSFSVVACMIGVMGLFFKFLVTNPMEVGVCRYFLVSREKGEAAELKLVFSAFSGSSYWNVVKVLFLRDLYTFLWTLLLVVPGIYKTLEYRMIPYLLSENPRMGAKEAFAKTRDLMDGNRLKSFLLDLSFIGWNLLASVAAAAAARILTALPAPGILWLTVWAEGLIVLLVSPYEKSANTELYLYLRYQPEVFDENGYRVY